jgi:dephospho-CoA kinase
MLKVALTGGIATGKSYVRARIAARGVPTADADAIVHALFAPGSDAVSEVARRFGAAVVAPDGRIDRKALGALVFRDDAARRDLEAIVHPRVYARIGDWTSLLERSGVTWLVADIPLLFESGRQGDFDRIIVAACPPDEQVRRLMQRDGLSQAAAETRIATQWPIAEKVRLATHVVDTGGPFDETDRQVDVICRNIEAAASSRPG